MIEASLRSCACSMSFHILDVHVSMLRSNVTFSSDGMFIEDDENDSISGDDRTNSVIFRFPAFQLGKVQSRSRRSPKPHRSVLV